MYCLIESYFDCIINSSLILISLIITYAATFLVPVWEYHTALRTQLVSQIEEGFSIAQAERMAWIASQKPKGKLVGFAIGSFLAFSWGHWHNRIQSYFGFRWSKLFTQSAITISTIIAFDYFFTVRRRGAIGDFWANKLALNNNLFFANLDSLVENFSILNRKFTENELKAFNDRRENQRSNIKNRKWIYNENIYTPEQFQRRIKVNTEGVWADKQIVNQIKAKYADKEDLTIAPVNLTQLLDHTGYKFYIPNQRHPDWTPMRR